MQPSLPKALETFQHQFDIRVFVDRNRSGWQMPMEWHVPLEIFMVLEGDGQYVIGGKSYEFQKGDVFVIGNNELHQSQVGPGGCFDAFVVMFQPDKVFPGGFGGGYDPLNLFYLRPEGFSHRLRPQRAKRQQYLGVARAMLAEAETGDDVAREALLALLRWLLLDLTRGYGRPGDTQSGFAAGEGVKHKRIITEALHYINEHYDEDINIGQLAAGMYINQSYLSREFKKSTGYSLTKFIANKRIREARELLEASPLSVTEVAIRVGYNSITHFHYVFKKETGCSPGEYRRAYQSKHPDKP